MDEIGGRLPLEGKPSGGRCEQEPLNSWQLASATADAAAVRVDGCGANGFDQRGSRAVALKIEGYLGMSPARPAGMSGG